jgi:hypothetical protein
MSSMIDCLRAKAVLPVFFSAVILVLGLGWRSATLACGTDSASWWHVTVSSRPTVLRPGGEGTVVVSATNLGDGEVNGDVTVRDRLPEHVVAKAGSYLYVGTRGERGVAECTGSSEIVCAFEGVLPPYESVEIDILVKVEGTAALGKVPDGVSISGGGAPSMSVSDPLTVGNESTGFGVEIFEFVPENANGSIDTQAGSHPFQETTTTVLNAGAEASEPLVSAGEVAQPALPKDLRFDLPPGFVGNPSPFEQCTEGQFEIEKCPLGAQIGAAGVTVANPLHYTASVPVFNMVPARGEPARFGFNDSGVPVFIDFSVRTGENYGVVASVDNITQTAAFLASETSLWGWPGDPRHDNSRGYGCLGGVEERMLHGGCNSPEDPVSAPFLSLPTSCSGEPFEASVEGDSWPVAEPGKSSEPIKDWRSFSQEPIPYKLHDQTEPSIAVDGCNELSFDPSIKVTPDVPEASGSTGLTVDLHVPQEEVLTPNGLAESEVKETTVTLPKGVAVNPAGGDGLAACSVNEIGYEPGKSPPAGSPPGDLGFSAGLPEPFCPDASKIGTVTVKTPLLPNPLEGAVYLATQEENPFKGVLAMYLVAEDQTAGVLVKLPGAVTADLASGQLTAKFASPQLPFEDAVFHFFGGERAPLTTPPLCKGGPGEEGYVTTTTIEPWSGNEARHPSSEFDITSGPKGSPCPNGRPYSPSLSQLPFTPTLTGGTTSNQAGGFSPFTMTMSRDDGNQQLQGIQLHTPPGLFGMLSTVKPCEEAQANAGTCGSESLIGETTVSVGVGGQPYTVTGGKVYITGPYHGAPYGLSIVNPAKAGPFDLEHTKEHHPACDCLVVRARIEVNPLTAALTVTANSPAEGFSIPTILEGIPLQIKHVNVTINRSSFTFNPTDCDPLKITGSLSSAEGASSSLEVPFQVTNCAALTFKPMFAAATAAHNSRVDGASLKTTVTYPGTPQGTEANIAKVKVSLPAKLPARLSTLQKACTEQTFAANPANCPAASRVGEATTKTPVLPNPLGGPAYFVSHGAAKYPELVIVLQGDNVTIDLHGETAISKKGILTSTFNTIPDAPFSSFELNLPEGPDSALTANGANLCKAGTLTMPTELVAQNGAMLKQSTKVKITGCPKVVHHKKAKRKGKKK